MPERLSNTQAIVLPVDNDTIFARDIVSMLENIYFDGARDQTTTLVGMLAIGDIPFPVVTHEDDDVSFPSIFPYVDFEEKAYVRNAREKKFFYK